MSAAMLAAALRGAGLRCRVEAYERMALIVPDETDDRLDDPGERARVVALAAEHGFTHVAVELMDRAGPGAPLSGD